MSILQSFNYTTRGAMSMTGNTLGLGDGNNITAFVTLDTTKQVPGYPAGTTLNWSENSSSAILVIPPGSTVIYAQLNWGGSNISIGVSPQDVTAFIDNAITFITPSGTNSVLPDPTYSQVFSFNGNSFYGRTKDVTSLVTGGGTYTVGGVPATITSTGNSINCAGWSLSVIYRNPSFPARNMTLYGGLQGISTLGGVSPVDIPLSGFLSPPSGPVAARLLFMALEGDPGTPNDTVSFGPDTASLALLSGPNNLSNNFFASQVNIANSASPSVGLIDTSGTFGTLNPTPGVTPPQGTRYGTDITNVAATNFTNNQTSAVIRLATTGDTYAIVTVGVQLDAVGYDFGDAPDISINQGPGDYRTLLSSDGPRHGVLTDLKLGTTVTIEDDAYQNSTATGDDIIEGIQDDGPIILPLTTMAYNAATYSFDISVRNNTGATTNLYAWLDFNQNGIFETNESFVTTVPTSAVNQTLTITFNRPVGVSSYIGQTFVRVRLTSENLVNSGGATAEDTRSYGVATDGEVEDYILYITNTPFTCNQNGYKVFS